MTTDDELLTLAEAAKETTILPITRFVEACDPNTIKRLVQRSKRLEEAEREMANAVAALTPPRGGQSISGCDLCGRPKTGKCMPCMSARVRANHEAFLAERGA